MFWYVGGLDTFFGEPDGIEWPGTDVAIPRAGLIFGFFVVTLVIESRPKRSNASPK